MLRVYISGALMGSSNLDLARSKYEAYALICVHAGCEPYLPHRNTDPEIMPDLSNFNVMERDVNQLTESDVVLAYLGEPSLGVGAEIAIAMQQEKYILALYEASKDVSRFMQGLLAKYPRARTCRFETNEEAYAWINRSLTSICHDMAS